MSYVIFEHIKGMDTTLADSISCLRSIHLSDSLDPEGRGNICTRHFWRTSHQKQTAACWRQKEQEGKEFKKFEI